MNKFFILSLLIPSICFAAGTGTLNDPYTTPAELAAETCDKTVYLKDGTYSGNVTLSQSCTSGTPLIFKCSNGVIENPGTCVMHDFTFGFSNAHYVTVSQMSFNTDDAGGGHPYVSFEDGTTYCTVTNNVFNGTTDGYGVRVGLISSNNQYNTISNNTFTGSFGGYVITVRYGSVLGITGNTHTTITGNSFTNLTHGNALIQIGLGQLYTDDEDNFAEITYNTLTNVNTASTVGEMMEIKASSNKVNYNIFNQVGGNVSFRVGNHNEFIGNIWINTADTGGSNITGLRVSGSDAKVINNYFEGLSEASCDTGGYSDVGVQLTWGGPVCNTSGVPVTTSALIANNTIRNTCAGFNMYQGVDCPTAPTGVIYINNLVESNAHIISPTIYLFCGQDCSVTSNTWTTNRGYDVHGRLVNPLVLSGVTDSGALELTKQKTGLTVNWYYPSVYTNGTYNANVTTDLDGQTRSDPPDIGCDEAGLRFLLGTGAVPNFAAGAAMTIQ